MKTKILIFMSILLWHGVTAQINNANHFNFGVSIGSANPLRIDKSIFVYNGVSTNFMFEYEKAISPRGSIQSGLQLNFLSLSMDAILDNNNKLLLAPDSIKYASINQVSLQIPLRYRVYKSENKYGRFYQFGSTLGYSFNNTFQYREGGGNKSEKISQVKPIQFAVHAGIGKRFSNNHILYVDWSLRMSNYFKQSQASNIYPMQLMIGMML